MTDSYLYVIVALLPLAAGMVILQESPYHALVIRGILGAIAAMTYAVLGAADVALTEALVGTMLAITLYAIAVRSSLVVRLGILETERNASLDQTLTELTNEFQRIFKKKHLRLELMPFANSQSLDRALADREIHAICDLRSPLNHPSANPAMPYHTTIRVKRLYEILTSELPAATANLSYVDIADWQQEWSRLQPADPSPEFEEIHS